MTFQLPTNNILVDSAVTVYPIHTDCKEEWLRHTVSLGSNTHVERLWFSTRTRKPSVLSFVSNHPDFK